MRPASGAGGPVREPSLLPENPGHTVLMLDGDTLSVRRAGQTPMALPAGDIGAALEASLGAGTGDRESDLLRHAAGLASTFARGRGAARRCASLKVQLLNSGPLPLLAPQLVAGQLHQSAGRRLRPQELIGQRLAALAPGGHPGAWPVCGARRRTLARIGSAAAQRARAR